MSDKLQQAVISAQGGDKSVLPLIYSETFIPVFFMLSEAFNSVDTAFLLIKRAYINAFRHISQAVGSVRFETLLKSAAIHECKLLIASQNTSQLGGVAVDKPEPVEPSIPKVFIADKQLRTLVLRKIKELPDDQRIAVILTYYGGISVNTLSDALGCTSDEAELALYNANRKVSSEINRLINDGFGNALDAGGDDAFTLLLRLCAKDCKIDLARYNALFADVSKSLDTQDDIQIGISIAEIKYRGTPNSAETKPVKMHDEKPAVADTGAIPISKTPVRDTVTIEKIDYTPSEPYEQDEKKSYAGAIILVVALALILIGVLGFAAYRAGLLPFAKAEVTTTSEITAAPTEESISEPATEATAALPAEETATTTTTAPTASSTAAETTTQRVTTTKKPDPTTTRVSGPAKIGTLTASPGESHVLNLRSAPNTGSEVLSSIPHGTTLDFYEYSSDRAWAKVKYNDTFGWVSLQFADVN